ncbi:hypothetical protein MTBBW1_420053 [Desulfamplus magnetovallimortis]|uniref:Uncharacterized protein n=1 Tax=Desulfamplus magnetovallimortis TaxID=1246637 RepID=A0A1W1HHD7_9BACT|nr:hypothetical protein [Desulfamplus magnetovallimortis]SLM31788.1 hypothetical protein MTBBW1_420053 [Desulfamplus magnetovallimortis]
MKVPNDNLDFETDEDILAATKRDKKQHSFFEKLYSWGKNIKHYLFGSQLGKDALLKELTAIKDEKNVDFKDSDAVAGIYLLLKFKILQLDYLIVKIDNFLTYNM